ncbi:aspartate/glutamate racemase family protein [Paenibacillus sp. SC116]|uniref:aspartate/glutamate racemase family protein n=1 Tax=Paenibacillus sp. SC116 TaxID=2968986 RepID=UPI00215ACCB6|nr:aspartate/glutamate racemase family protein [Paenibacillus sp. SC116]MCR8842281.1 aspartate/glutamate racemase family protein [Paenibacillus sp. SC116]
MKTIGLIGGMSWESSAQYYRIINEQVKQRLGGLHSAKCIMYSVDFDEIARFQSNGDWEGAGEHLANAAESLQRAGADFILIGANTMHKVVEAVEARITIPVLHIADATANQIQKAGLKKVGLLGTKYTMEEDFLIARVESHGIEVSVPEKADRQRVHNIIYEELCRGEFRKESKDYYIGAMKKLIDDGAEGIILGCTEIGLLVTSDDIDIPLFDTAFIHALESVKMALEVE